MGKHKRQIPLWKISVFVSKPDQERYLHREYVTNEYKEAINEELMQREVFPVNRLARQISVKRRK